MDTIVDTINFNTDIDIDTPDRDKLLKLFNHTPAMIKRKHQKIKHNTGVYFHKVPIDPFTNMCNIDYNVAEEMGFFKIDILNVSFYKDIKDEEHLQKLIDKEPIWELFEYKDFCDNIFQLSGHHSICKIMKPRCLEHMAAILAMIRPSKRYLIGQPWNIVLNEIWIKPLDDGYYFKKSHSFSYAMAVIVNANLLCEKIITDHY
jgi:DNA polymerase III alpha subunit